MIKVVIKKQNVVTNIAEFETQELVDAWIVENETIKAWGLPEHWVEESKITTENIADAIETAQIPNPFPRDGEPETLTMYKFAAEYTIEQTDVTSESAYEGLVNKGLSAQSFGAKIIAKVWALNEAKFEAGALSTEQFQAILADSTVATIERLLWNGSIKTAKALVQSSNITFFSSAEKAIILAEMTEFIASQG